jgi:DNA-binding winged helix-turn-helix (wHTH) protein
MHDALEQLGGTRIELGSRGFDILMLLIEARGELVSKVELMSRVWSGIVVEENTLQSHVWALRNALGKERDLIRTVSGRGYRFIGQLEEVEQSTDIVERTFDSLHVSHRHTRVHMLPVAPRAMTNLPSTVSPLTGRSTDLAELIGLIRHRRLLTLLGAGGIGKTRLALEAARLLLSYFPDGVWLTELAPLSDSYSISAAIVAALGVQISTPELSATRLGAAFGTRHMLLVLDNCEHVIDAAATFIEDLLRATSGLQIVMTSREPLGVEGEQVYQVAPLSSPPEQATGAAEVLAYEAAQFTPSGRAVVRITRLHEPGPAQAEAGPVRRSGGGARSGLRKISGGFRNPRSESGEGAAGAARLGGTAHSESNRAIDPVVDHGVRYG